MAKRKSKSSKRESSGIKDIFIPVFSSAVGKLFFLILALAGVLSFNILVTKNQMEQFLFLTGIQIIIGIILFWISFIIKYRK